MEVINLKEEMRACGICGKLHPVSELTEFGAIAVLDSDRGKRQIIGEQYTVPLPLRSASRQKSQEVTATRKSDI